MFLNVLRAKQILARYGLDALVATTPENVAYLTGFWALTSLRHRARQVYAVLHKKDMATDMVLSRGLIDHALHEESWVRQYYEYGNFFWSIDKEHRMDVESMRL